jgi:hypothetical protein
VTERFAYLAFLTVTATALAVMTLGLLVIGFLLLRQNRRAKRR